MIYLMIFIKKKILGINIDIIYRFFVYDFFLKGEMKIFNGDVLNFDDLFGDDEDYEKFVVLVKS